jgi:hypothetical protein
VAARGQSAAADWSASPFTIIRIEAAATRFCSQAFPDTKARVA